MDLYAESVQQYRLVVRCDAPMFELAKERKPLIRFKSNREGRNASKTL